MPADHRQEPSLYDVLQVRADSSSRDIARAYRRLARAWHPDARPADAGAAARFQAVSDAYELLSDPVRRAAYDERRAASASAATTPPASRPRPAPGGLPIRPGPVRVGPLPGYPAGSRASAEAAARASTEARLLVLAELVRAFLGDERSWPW